MELSPAQSLLLAGAAVLDGPARAERAREALARGVDWLEFVRLARDHRVAPLAQRALAGIPLDAAGERARGELADEARQCLYVNLLLAGALRDLLERFAVERIDVVPYKGPALAVAAYGSLALRPCGDLDLLVRERDFDRARAVVGRAGFVPAADRWAAVRHLSHEQAFDARDGELQVDLHGRLFSRELFPAPLEPLLARRVPVRVGEREVRTFRPEDLLVILAEHAHKHLWVRLSWLADLAHLCAAHPALDWRAVGELARATGSRRVLGIGLRLAAELLAAPVPEDVLAPFHADPEIGALGDQVRRRLFAGPRGDPLAVGLELSTLQWRSRERWSDRLRYLLTPNESDWMLLPLPARWRFVYYALRPFRLLARYGLEPLRRLG